MGEGGLSSSLTTSNSSNITKNITDINIGKDFSEQKITIFDQKLKHFEQNYSHIGPEMKPLHMKGFNTMTFGNFL